MTIQTKTCKPLLRALRGDPQTPPPIWLMRQAGRYLPEYREIRQRAGDFLSLCYTPELAAEVTLQPIRRFGMDGAILFSDILVVPDALGAKVSFREGDGPRVSLVRDATDIARLSAEDLHNHLAPVYETVERVAAALPKDVALIGFAGAPWTVATYMVEGRSSKDFMYSKLWALTDPDGFQPLIDLLVDATADYLIEQIKHGAELVQIFDSWAGVLPESGFERWCVAPTRELVLRLKTFCPEIPVIGFPRGAGAMLAHYAEATGVDAVSLDSSLSPRWAACELQPKLAIQGNLDPILLFGGGPAMVAEIRAILTALGGGPFVFNLGHGVVPKTPPENVALLVETVRSWRP